MLMKQTQGFSLIESMIALVIISVAILGVASLQVNTGQFNARAQWHEMAVRMNAEMTTRIGLQNINFSGYSQIDTSNAYTQDCLSGPCTDAAMVIADAADWKKEIEDILPLGRGKITGIDATTLDVTVFWDAHNTGATGINCSGDSSIDLTCFKTTIIKKQ